MMPDTEENGQISGTLRDSDTAANARTDSESDLTSPRIIDFITPPNLNFKEDTAYNGSIVVV
jgi:hypothetical protein